MTADHPVIIRKDGPTLISESTSQHACMQVNYETIPRVPIFRFLCSTRALCTTGPRQGWAPSGRPGDNAPLVRTVPGDRSGAWIVACAERVDERMRHTPGLPGCGRWTTILGIAVLALAMLWLGSLATAFYTQLECDRWLQIGTTGFVAAMGLSARFFITPHAGTCWALSSARETYHPGCAGRWPR
jgi:hypothetical protein